MTRSLPLTFPLRRRRWIRRPRLPSGRWATLPPPRRRPLRPQVPRRPQAPRHRCLLPLRAARPFHRRRLRRRMPPRRQPPCLRLRQTPTPRPTPRPSSRASGATWSLSSSGRVPVSCRALASSPNVPSRPCRCFCDVGGFVAPCGAHRTAGRVNRAASTVRPTVATTRRAAYGRPGQPYGRLRTASRGSRTASTARPVVAIAQGTGQSAGRAPWYHAFWIIRLRASTRVAGSVSEENPWPVST